MLNILALSQSDTEKLLDMPTVIEKVTEAYQLEFQKNGFSLSNDLP